MAIEQQRPSLEYFVRDPRELAPEKYPGIEVVQLDFKRATGRTAIRAWLDIMGFTGGKEEEFDLPVEEKARRTLLLDNNAGATFTDTVSTFPYFVNILNAEGKKEKYSYVGQATDTFTGMHGSGLLGVEIAVDYTEQSGNGVHGRKGTTSMVGITDPGGLTPIPDIYNDKGELEEANYSMKLFAPKDLRSVLSVEKSAKENINDVKRYAGIPADRIQLAVMARKANASILKDAEDMGVDLKIIKSGDLEWCINANISSPENPIIMMGRGGAPEGQIAAIGARALGAVGDQRVYEANGKDIELEHKSPIWKAEDFVPGLPEHCVVVFSAVMPNSTFNMDPVIPHSQEKDKYVVSSRILSSKGLSGVIKDIVEYRQAA